MNRIALRATTSAALLCGLAIGAAAEETTAEKRAATAERAAAAAADITLAPPTDRGRRFFVRSSIHGRRIVGELGAPGSTELACVDGGSQLVGTTQPVVVSEATGEDKTYQIFYVQTVKTDPGWFDGLLSPPHRECALNTGEGRVAAGDRFLARTGEVASAVPISAGPTWGLFAAPFKYQLSGKQRLEGGATAGAYLGYELGDQLFAFEVAPIVFFGASNIDVTQIVDGQEKKQNLFAMSYGGGIKFSLSDTFDIGLVVGWDHTNDESNYEYNDKPWVAAQFGIAVDKMFK